jgi:hypothetical protein
MRHPMVGCGTSLVDHAASDDQRYPNRAKFAASGRQKGAPGDSPVFRIIIRLENARRGETLAAQSQPVLFPITFGYPVFDNQFRGDIPSH